MRRQEANKAKPSKRKWEARPIEHFSLPRCPRCQSAMLKRHGSTTKRDGDDVRLIECYVDCLNPDCLYHFAGIFS